MDNIEYFKKVIGLYEAAEVIPAQQPEELQSQIADNGSDVNPNAQAQDIAPEGGLEAQPEEPAMEEVPVEEPLPAGNSTFELEKQKQIKLFDLLLDLLNYGSVFIESIERVDISLLELDKYVKIKRYASNIKELVDKISIYVRKLYPSDSYEKMVYNYVLYRTELLTNIKGIRNVLELNNPDGKIE